MGTCNVLIRRAVEKKAHAGSELAAKYLGRRSPAVADLVTRYPLPLRRKSPRNCESTVEDTPCGSMNISWKVHR